MMAVLVIIPVFIALWMGMGLLYLILGIDVEAIRKENEERQG